MPLCETVCAAVRGRPLVASPTVSHFDDSSVDNLGARV